VKPHSDHNEDDSQLSMDDDEEGEIREARPVFQPPENCMSRHWWWFITCFVINEVL
jgi:hypothetical protein